MTNQKSHNKDKTRRVEMSTHREASKRSERKLVTRGTSREANRMSHVIEVGTAEGASVLDRGQPNQTPFEEAEYYTPEGG